MSRYLITARNVEKLYPPNTRAIRDISFEVKPGEFVFVYGGSGAGKTTLLKMLFGAETPNRGDVVMLGMNMATASREEIRSIRRRIGVVFQDYRLLRSATVIDNVALSLEVFGVKARSRYQLAYRLLSALGLGRKGDLYPYQLSGGEQQRVALARALVNRPTLVLADEPTGNLDPEMSQLVFDILDDVNKAGATVIVASHDVDTLRGLNRRTLMLRDGALVGDFASFSQCEPSM